ncbi:hypothetical protein BCF59_0100 [Mycoplasmopsis mustelae]|uniref:Lipoprotein n=1 Tax=Mycoplasmopsis mustelae TaxID=171289 RepID=A0A4R7UCI4_9BACT|nr:hypothetical protein [Mycoplasmopsis mustelae]TDV24152.1 hypothetical protein BCF59_0100 [Mycoplasmopsis mustelae]
MKLKKGLKLAFITSTITIPLITISCTTGYNQADNNLKQLSKFTNEINQSTNPRYKYIRAISNYLNKSLNETFIEINHQVGEVSNNDWINFATTVSLKIRFLNELKQKLDQIPDDKINNSTFGIGSSRFLEMYKFIYGLNAENFKQWKETSDEFLYIVDYNLLQKGLQYNYFLEINDINLENLTKDTQNTYKLLNDINFKETEKQKENFNQLSNNPNPSLHLNNLIINYQKNLAEYFKGSEIESKWTKFTQITQQLFDFFENFFKNSRDIYVKIDDSFLQTLQFQPILSNEQFNYLRNCFEFLQVIGNEYFKVMIDLRVNKNLNEKDLNELINDMKLYKIFDKAELNALQKNIETGVNSRDIIYQKLLDIFNTAYDIKTFAKNASDDIQRYLQMHSK